MAKRRFMEFGELPGEKKLTLAEQRALEKEKVKCIFTLSNIFEKYVKRGMAQGFSESTIKSYYDMMHILELFRDNLQVSDVNRELYEDYIIWLREERKVAPATVNSYAKAVKAFFNWMIEEKYVEHFKMHVPSFNKPLKELYTDEELKILLAKPDLNVATFAEFRCWVMESYFLSTGQRLRSVINIKNSDVDLNNGLVVLRQTKNREEVILPLSDSICEILKEWQKVRGTSPDDYLFCKYDGRQMTRRGVEEAVSLYNRNRGVQKTGIHLFRHTFAYRYLMAGGDVFRLQKLMTHKEINITKEYLNLQINDIKANYSEVNPLDLLLKKDNKVQFDVRNAEREYKA